MTCPHCTCDRCRRAHGPALDPRDDVSESHYARHAIWRASRQGYAPKATAAHLARLVERVGNMTTARLLRMTERELREAVPWKPQRRLLFALLCWRRDDPRLAKTRRTG